MGYEQFSVYLNNLPISKKEIKKIFSSIQDKAILQEKGGFLFKSSICNLQFHIGILPNIIEDSRSYHYNIKLQQEDAYVFSGMLNLDGTIRLLFTPPVPRETISAEFKDALRRRYIDTAGVLICNGIEAAMPLDWVSKKMLEEVQIFAIIPENIGQFHE